MNVQVEDLGKNMVKLIVELDAKTTDDAIRAVYNRQRSRISLPGFRKGKVPQAMVEKMYGQEVFYEDAANDLVKRHYPEALEQSRIDVVSRPKVEVTQMEKGRPFIFEAEVAKRPDVTLGKYEGVAVTKADTSVGDGEVDAEIERQRNANARIVNVTDRPVREGDTAVIDFEGFADGVAFEGGKGENHPLVIGSHTFIDTFEDQLIGKNAGEETEVNVTFPEQYQARELAGKQAVFKVKVNEIRERVLPELDDEYVQDISEFDTVEEYRADVREQLEKLKKNEAKAAQEDEAIMKIIEKSEMEIPDAMIELQEENLIDEFAQRLAFQGTSLQQYLQMAATTIDKLREQVHPDALQRIQSSLVLEAIAKAENITASPEDIQKHVEDMAGQYGIDAAKFMEDLDEDGRDSLKRDVEVQKAVDFVMEHVVECEKAELDAEAGAPAGDGAQ